MKKSMKMIKKSIQYDLTILNAYSFNAKTDGYLKQLSMSVNET